MRDPQKAKEARSRYLEKNAEKEAERKRQWKRDHREHCKAYNKKWFEENREKAREYNRDWLRKNRDKPRAEHTARYHIPLKENCEICGKKARDRHHENYVNPLLVIHVCPSCHRKLDAERRKP